jgi:hypothetical protein
MPDIICEECGKTVESTNHNQKLCPECRPKVYRRRATECERTRRATSGDAYRAYDRQIKSKPETREKRRQMSKDYYYRMKDNPEYMAKVNANHKGEMDAWLDRRDFGGNWYKVYERDGGICQMCGSIKNIMVHHIDGNGAGKLNPEEKNNGMSNLVLLCKSCHAKIHRLGRKKSEWSVISN